MYKRGERQVNQLMNVQERWKTSQPTDECTREVKDKSTNWLMYKRGERQVNQLINVQERWKTSQLTD